MPERLIDQLKNNAKLSEASGETALLHQVVNGGALDTALLELGLVEPSDICEAMASAYRCPVAKPEEVFAKAEARCLRSIPERWANKHELAPMRIDAESLLVMTPAPPDLALLRRLSELLDLKLRPVIAPELWVHQRLCFLYDKTLPLRFEALLAKRSEFKIPGKTVDPEPSQLPIPEPIESLDLDEARAVLAQAQSRDALLMAALRHAHSFLAFAAFFVPQSDRLKGLLGIGQGAERVRGLSLSLSEVSAFRLVIDNEAFYLGAPPESPVHERLSLLTGRERPDELLILPLKIRDRIVALLYADNGHDPIEPIWVSKLEHFLDEVESAFQRLLTATKRPNSGTQTPKSRSPRYISQIAAAPPAAQLKDVEAPKPDFMSKLDLAFASAARFSDDLARIPIGKPPSMPPGWEAEGKAAQSFLKKERASQSPVPAPSQGFGYAGDWSEEITNTQSVFGVADSEAETVLAGTALKDEAIPDDDGSEDTTFEPIPERRPEDLGPGQTSEFELAKPEPDALARLESVALELDAVADVGEVGAEAERDEGSADFIPDAERDEGSPNFAAKHGERTSNFEQHEHGERTSNFVPEPEHAEGSANFEQPKPDQTAPKLEHSSDLANSSQSIIFEEPTEAWDFPRAEGAQTPETTTEAGGLPEALESSEFASDLASAEPLDVPEPASGIDEAAPTDFTPPLFPEASSSEPSAAEDTAHTAIEPSRHDDEEPLETPSLVPPSQITAVPSAASDDDEAEIDTAPLESLPSAQPKSSKSTTEASDSTIPPARSDSETASAFGDPASAVASEPPDSENFDDRVGVEADSANFDARLSAELEAQADSEDFVAPQEPEPDSEKFDTDPEKFEAAHDADGPVEADSEDFDACLSAELQAQADSEDFVALPEPQNETQTAPDSEKFEAAHDADSPVELDSEKFGAEHDAEATDEANSAKFGALSELEAEADAQVESNSENFEPDVATEATPEPDSAKLESLSELQTETDANSVKFGALSDLEAEAEAQLESNSESFEPDVATEATPEPDSAKLESLSKLEAEPDSVKFGAEHDAEATDEANSENFEPDAAPEPTDEANSAKFEAVSKLEAEAQAEPDSEKLGALSELEAEPDSVNFDATHDAEAQVEADSVNFEPLSEPEEQPDSANFDAEHEAEPDSANFEPDAAPEPSPEANSANFEPDATPSPEPESANFAPQAAQEASSAPAPTDEPVHPRPARVPPASLTPQLDSAQQDAFGDVLRMTIPVGELDLSSTLPPEVPDLAEDDAFAQDPHGATTRKPSPALPEEDWDPADLVIETPVFETPPVSDSYQGEEWPDSGLFSGEQPPTSTGATSDEEEDDWSDVKLPPSEGDPELSSGLGATPVEPPLTGDSEWVPTGLPTPAERPDSKASIARLNLAPSDDVLRSEDLPFEPPVEVRLPQVDTLASHSTLEEDSEPPALAAPLDSESWTPVGLSLVDQEAPGSTSEEAVDWAKASLAWEPSTDGFEGSDHPLLGRSTSSDPAAEPALGPVLEASETDLDAVLDPDQSPGAEHQIRKSIIEDTTVPDLSAEAWVRASAEFAPPPKAALPEVLARAALPRPPERQGVHTEADPLKAAPAILPGSPLDIANPSSQPGIEAQQKAIQDLVSDNPLRRSEAEEGLRAMGSKALPQLAEAFPGPLRIDPFLVQDSFPPFAECGPLLALLVNIGPEAHGFLSPYLEVKSPQQRFFAVYFYSAVYVPEAVPRLIRRLHDEESRICMLAARTLFAYRDHPSFARVQSHLAGRLNATSIGARSHATYLVGLFRDTSLIPRLIQVFEDKERPMYDVTQQALAQITKQNFGINARRWRNWWNKNQDRSRIDWLIEGLSAKEESIRQSAIDELHGLSGHNLGYHPAASRRDREAAKQRWLAWRKQS